MDVLALFQSIRPRYPEFQGKVALITGSGRGIGKGIAIRLAREGMKIVVHGLEADEVAQTTDELTQAGATVTGIASDLSTLDGIEQLMNGTVDAFGTIDVLVNNAALLSRKPMFQIDTALLDSHINTNIRGVYLCSRYAAEIMRKHGGNIVNISSVGGLRAHWRGLPYDITKGAIDSMTRAMALELAADGIRVNAVAPGAIMARLPQAYSDTYVKEVSARIPLQRLGTTLEIGNVVAFLASDDAAYITGQVIYVDGGITVQLSPPGQPI